MTTHKTQVAIIGSGPSGLLLGQLLTLAGIDNIIIDRVSKEYILSRVRAGVLEEGTVAMLDKADIGPRIHEEGMLHGGFTYAFSGRVERIDLNGLINKNVMVYGQTEVTQDLMDARERSGAKSIYEVDQARPVDFDRDKPYVAFKKDGVDHRIECEFIAGCDGYHGPSRKSVSSSALTTYEKEYPFGWLGILVDVPPVRHEIIYANHARGFGMCSMRSPTRSRYYIQCEHDDHVDNWTDDQFWDELRRRLPQDVADDVTTGPSFEKSIAPLRSFVAEPMRFNKLFLVGDAAHIVPPTGAKGLNLAVSDVHYPVRFSWWFTTCMHRFPTTTEFDQKIQESDLDYLSRSTAAQTAVAENYVGLPF
jgi:p-hydroxybenzoate 3-monooxygenase